MIQEGIRLAIEGKNLSSEMANHIMDEMMSGSAAPSQMAAFLTAMRMKGETRDELLGFVKCMRSKAIRVSAPEGAVDLCGTGGDGLSTFNISTVSAFVAASAGASVAKHGNRAVSSRSGSADLLMALGIPIETGREGVERCLSDTGIGFMFAPEFHGSMRNVAAIRRELGVRTFFNILGPMANPASVKRQLIGVYDTQLSPTIAEVLNELGTEHAMIVNGGGMDEITTLGPTNVTELHDGRLSHYTISPEEFGIDLAEPQELIGGSARENAQIAVSVLRGKESHRLDIVALNAAAALYVAGKSADIQEGMSIARKAIRSGKALAKLRQFHDSCAELESKAQLRADMSELRGRRIQPEALKTRCAELSSDLTAQISSTDEGQEHLDRLDPDMMANPTVLTVLTLNRLGRIMSGPQMQQGMSERAKLKLSESIARAPGIAVIGEYKPRSPSSTRMVLPPEPEEVAGAYTKSGLAGISVLAEEDYFLGGADLFRKFRSMLSAPMLFKDFITTEAQIDVASEAGADSVLLIAKALRREALDDLVRGALARGMEPLVEVHDDIDLEKVISCKTYGTIDMIGINARDLRSLDVDVGRAIGLRELVDQGKMVIAESGVRSPRDLKSLKGFDGVLIGSMFMKSEDIGRLASETAAAAMEVEGSR